jgi:hypothetical protein
MPEVWRPTPCTNRRRIGDGPDPGWRSSGLQRVSHVISNVVSAGGSVPHVNQGEVV